MDVFGSFLPVCHGRLYEVKAILVWALSDPAKVTNSLKMFIFYAERKSVVDYV